jgi:hypothetical protein
MIGEESGFIGRKAASSTARSTRLAGFLEYMAGVLAAFVHPEPTRAGDEDRVPAPAAGMMTCLPVEPPAPGGTAGRAGHGQSPRAPGLVNRSRAPRIYMAGGSRRIGFAIIGGSLDARLSHDSAARGGKPGGMRPQAGRPDGRR